MNFLAETSVLSDHINENLQLIPVISRFGIRLGLGDKTVHTICTEYNLNTDFVLAILNTYLNEDYFPEKKLQEFDIALVSNYLKQTDQYYAHALVPNIEKHLNAFIAMSDPGNKQLTLISKLFVRFKEELMSRIRKGLLEDDTAHALLFDLKNILVKHISGNFNENLCYAVVFSIDSLAHDLNKHNRIRERILKPMIDNLADAGIDDWQSLIAGEKSAVTDESLEISPRELEVLKLVAMGLLNKEVADRLNISLNTVLSHRKNITAKLGIKTVSGLIFYCISHGYISADEIEL
ncbi:DNA-binding CsgD family transcriptional regulator [Dysgonomonas sp. PH5-45]|uniref:LuxR C-terminal-related transcriptional regulator n=1 Tax=unclassified Dysgonomonas TaxID=2630389 RepID=UPI002473BAC1|nr:MULTISPECIES: LuxR C-terminal-related transcriptional regulator [unclassified Dysgonomonas]MDH6354562.1 DNA-binding CsgD family transcriptional regulator [Dysgonomonas sp. PH5-45]MDH6387382.1 DNA-binding CsgD family transcriptional regulator [Dysgonomonas sp. PH5-37]